MATEAIRVTAEGVTLSLLVWRKFKRQRTGFIERVLDLNPGLAELGVFIPPGTVVTFPIDPPGTKIDDTAIALWD